MKHLSLSIILLSFICFEAYTQSIENLYQSGLECYEHGANKQALFYANEVLKRDSSIADYYLLRARIHFNLGNYNKTISDCYSTSRIKSRTPEVYLLRGKVCNVTKSYGGAILFFGKAIQNTTEPSILKEAYFHRGIAYMTIRRYPDASNDFNMALTFDETNVEYQSNLAKAYFQQNRLQEASNINDGIIEQYPNNAEAYELKGNIEQHKNNLPGAIEAFQTYTKLSPDNIMGHHSLALSYLESDNIESAWASLSNAIQIDPKEPITYKTQGVIHLKKGETEKACNSYFKAMQLGYLEKYDYDLLEEYKKICEE